MNKLTTRIAPLLSALTLVFVASVSAGCIAGEQTESDRWEDLGEEELVGTDEEAVKAGSALPAPSPAVGDGCWCCCENDLGVDQCWPLARVPLHYGCSDVCSNYFHKNADLCSGPGRSYLQ